MTDIDIAKSLQRQLQLCADALSKLGHTIVSENGEIIDVIPNRIAASLVAQRDENRTTLVNAGPHDVVVTDPTGTSHHRAKPGDPVAIYSSP